jgi:hypothetical protein
MHQADYFFLCVAGRWWERREIVELRGRRLHDTFHRAAAESKSNQPLFAYWGAEQPTIIFMREPEKSWIGSAPPLWCKIRHGRCCRSLIETLHFPRHQFSLAGRQLPRFFFSSLSACGQKKCISWWMLFWMWHIICGMLLPNPLRPPSYGAASRSLNYIFFSERGKK